MHPPYATLAHIHLLLSNSGRTVVIIFHSGSCPLSSQPITWLRFRSCAAIVDPWIYLIHASIRVVVVPLMPSSSDSIAYLTTPMFHHFFILPIEYPFDERPHFGTVLRAPLNARKRTKYAPACRVIYISLRFDQSLWQLIAIYTYQRCSMQISIDANPVTIAMSF